MNTIPVAVQTTGGMVVSPSAPAQQVEQTNDRKRYQRGEEPRPRPLGTLWALEFTVEVGLLCWPHYVFRHYFPFAFNPSFPKRASDIQ
jgi:hypothetical protein